MCDSFRRCLHELNCWHRNKFWFSYLYSFHNSVVSGVYSFHLRVVTARKLLLVSLGVVEISDLFGVGSHLWFLILASA